MKKKIKISDLIMLFKEESCSKKIEYEFNKTVCPDGDCYYDLVIYYYTNLWSIQHNEPNELDIVLGKDLRIMGVEFESAGDRMSRTPAWKRLCKAIAEDEEVPKEIWYSNNKWEYRYDNRYHNKTFDYPCKDEHDLSERFGLMNFGYLNDEIEIIEEEKKINYVSTYVLCDSDFERKDQYSLKAVEIIDKAFEEYSDAINDLIDEVNKLKKEGK